MYTVAVDIGGTFTDVVAIDGASGRMAMGKALTTPADLQRGVLDGLADAAGELGLQVGALLAGTSRMVHATTQSSNAVFAFSGAKTAVLTTRGFGDTLVIMRATGRVAGLSVFERHHYRATDKPRLLADERDIFEIAERVDHAGRVVVPLDEAAVRAAAREIRRRGYRRSRSRTSSRTRTPRTSAAQPRSSGAEAPELYVSISSDVAPVIGEYERSATALFNAYVGPVVAGYLARLERTLARRRPQAEAADRPGERRRDDDVAGRADLHGGVGPGGRASSAPRTSRSTLGTSGRHRDRRRRHHVQGRAHPRRRVGLQPRDGAEPVSAPAADDRRRLDRRRRRLDRVGRRPAPARRPAERGGRTRDRPATGSAAQSRPSPTPISCSATSRPTASSADAWRCIPERARAKRSPGESRRRSSAATCSPPRPASGRSSTARWRTSSARSRSSVVTTPRDFAMMAYGGCGPAHAALVRRGRRRDRDHHSVLRHRSFGRRRRAVGHALQPAAFGADRAAGRSGAARGDLRHDGARGRARARRRGRAARTRRAYRRWVEARFRRQVHHVRDRRAGAIRRAIARRPRARFRARVRAALRAGLGADRRRHRARQLRRRCDRRDRQAAVRACGRRARGPTPRTERRAWCPRQRRDGGDADLRRAVARARRRDRRVRR